MQDKILQKQCRVAGVMGFLFMAHAVAMAQAGVSDTASSKVKIANDSKEILSQPQQQKSVSVTVYNADLALVKDVRLVPLNAGFNAVAWRGVSAQMRPETALLRDMDNVENLFLIEQNFDFDLLTPNKLLEKYVGEKVRIVKTHPQTGAQTSEDATVLAANQGVVLQFSDRVETKVDGHIVFGSVPRHLRDKPTLVIHAQSKEGNSRNVELSYLTKGLSWKTDYVTELSGDEKYLTLNGWVTLVNKSGAAYNNAKLQFVAGDVNQVPEITALRRERSVMPMMDVAAAPVAKMEQEALMDYHLYTLPLNTTLLDNQTKQVALLSAAKIPATKEYRLNGRSHYYEEGYSADGVKEKVAVSLTIDNKEPHLGQPMPKGVVRVYKRDSAGNAQFVGEDRIDHTAKGQTIKLTLGNAFDVTALRKSVDFKRVDSAEKRETIFESEHKIELSNAKKEDVDVIVTEPIVGSWKMLKQNVPHKKVAANAAQWTVHVPAQGSAVLTYRVQTRF